MHTHSRMHALTHTLAQTKRMNLANQKLVSFMCGLGLVAGGDAGLSEAGLVVSVGVASLPAAVVVVGIGRRGGDTGVWERVGLRAGAALVPAPGDAADGDLLMEEEDDDDDDEGPPAAKAAAAARADGEGG